MDSQKQLGNNLAKTQNKKARSKAVKPIKFPSIALLRVGKYWCFSHSPFPGSLSPDLSTDRFLFSLRTDGEQAASNAKKKKRTRKKYPCVRDLLVEFYLLANLDVAPDNSGKKNWGTNGGFIKLSCCSNWLVVHCNYHISWLQTSSASGRKSKYITFSGIEIILLLLIFLAEP